MQHCKAATKRTVRLHREMIGQSTGEVKQLQPKLEPVASGELFTQKTIVILQYGKKISIPDVLVLAISYFCVI